MLHCNHEASTGWTRNSWLGSRTKKVASLLTQPLIRCTKWGPANAEWPESTIRSRTAARASRSRAGHARARVDVAAARSYAATATIHAGRSPIVRSGGPSRVTVSEFAFLALGLILGVASGAAFIVISNARAPAVNEIRLTVTPNAIPRRRRSTLSEDAFSDHSVPARGGPAERQNDDRDGALRWVADGSGMRTIVRSAPLPPAGAGDPESGAQGPVRIGGGGPWPAAGRNRLALPASIVASYPADPDRDELPLVA